MLCITKSLGNIHLIYRMSLIQMSILHLDIDFNNYLKSNWIEFLYWELLKHFLFILLRYNHIRDTAGEVGTSSWVMYSCGPLYMDEQRQNNQLEPTYSSSVLIWDVVLKTCWKQWTIGRGGERGSGISMLMVRHNDDDDDNHKIYKCLV